LVFEAEGCDVHLSGRGKVALLTIYGIKHFNKSTETRCSSR